MDPDPVLVRVLVRVRVRVPVRVLVRVLVHVLVLVRVRVLVRFIHKGYMMVAPKYTKAKGNKREKEYQTAFEALGYPVMRGSAADQNTATAADIIVPGGRTSPLASNSGRVRPALYIEVKDQKRMPSLLMLQAFAQADTAAPSPAIPALACHEHRGDDYIMLRLSDFLRIWGDAYPQ